MYSPLSLDSVKTAVNDALRLMLEERTAEAATISARYEKFWQVVTSATLAGGKRLRPYLTVVAYGKLDDTIVRVSCAQELLHVAMLMHDDIIDRDDVRHGTENVVGMYLQDYESLAVEDARHYAISAGILAGDILLSEAHYQLASAEIETEKMKNVLRRFNQSIFEVIGGELLDVENGILDERIDPLVIARYKTAGYSIVGPLLSGAYARGADASTIKALEEFGNNFGIAYQLQDDLLGVIGDSKVTGKSTLTDIREGKHTALSETYRTTMTEEQANKYHTVFGNQMASDEAIEDLSTDIRSSGAVETVRLLADRYVSLALDALETIDDNALATNLRELVRLYDGRAA